MRPEIYQLVGDDFQLGYRTQDYWGWKIALAFFFGEVGAGLFFISAFYNFMMGMVVGWIMVSVFKPTALFMHLGQPMRAWRAIMGLKHSWISRGLLASVLFTGCGFLHMLDQHYHMLAPLLSSLLYLITMISCFGVMIYLGFVLSYSPAIPLWDTGLMPIMSLTYGLLGGVTLVLLFGYYSFLAGHPETIKLLKALEFGLVLFCASMIASFLYGAALRTDAGQKSVTLLLKEDFSRWFLGGVVGIGLIFTALLIDITPVSFAVLLTIAIAELIGDIGMKIMLFRAGTYQPTISHNSY